jgi:hypothetical protein
MRESDHGEQDEEGGKGIQEGEEIERQKGNRQGPDSQTEFHAEAELHPEAGSLNFHALKPGIACHVISGFFASSRPHIDPAENRLADFPVSG